MRSIEEIKAQYQVNLGKRGVTAEIAALRAVLLVEGYIDVGRETTMKRLDLAICQALMPGAAGLAVTERQNGGKRTPTAYWRHWYVNPELYGRARLSLPRGARTIIKTEDNKCVARVVTGDDDDVWRWEDKWLRENC